MADRSGPRLAAPGPATACAALMFVLILIGAVLWYVPNLTSKSTPVAEVPAPSGLFSASRYTVPPHGRACMPNVAVTPDSHQVAFDVFGVGHGRSSAVRVTFSGTGYRGVAHLSGGYPGGYALLPFAPPAHSLLTRACFENRGTRAVAFTGTDEARTISRSIPLTINGRQVAGDIAFSFFASHRTDAVGLLSTIARHASNLSDGLLPPVLIWVLGVLIAFGIPVALVLAFRAALLEDPEFNPSE